MGMDLLGNAPANRRGEYFSLNNSGWFVMWTFVRDVSETARLVIHWDTNDGDGLDAEQARQVAADLRQALAESLVPINSDAGVDYREWVEAVLPYVSADRRERLEELFCTGVSWAEKTREFAEFLENCGGFEIL